jgi:hypothetical protein
MERFRTVLANISSAGSRLDLARDQRLSLSRRLTRQCQSHLALRRTVVTISGSRDTGSTPHLIQIGLEKEHIRIGCQDALIISKPDEVLHRVWGVLTVVAGAPSLEGAELVAEISDGEESGPGLISFCSRDPDAILIPDHVFIRTRGYEIERALARANVMDWDERSDRIVWRGSSTGAGLISKPYLSADDPELIMRVRLCLVLNGMPDTDVKLSGIAQSANKALDSERLAGAGILGEFVSPLCWYGSKFAIDIDGNSNAWSNFFTRLLIGCCVLKVVSRDGYRQWYYGDSEPWIHYVPVKADLSDLHERIAWCRANLAECREIAARGQEFAMARDFDTEVALAARRLRDAHALALLR